VKKTRETFHTKLKKRPQISKPLNGPLVIWEFVSHGIFAYDSPKDKRKLQHCEDYEKLDCDKSEDGQ